MPLIIDLSDPSGFRGRRNYKTEATTVGAALLDVYPNGFSVDRDIYLDTLNSEPLTIDDMDKPLSDQLFVVTRVQGKVGDVVGKVFQPIKWAFQTIGDWLYPMPDIPDFSSPDAQDDIPQNNLPTAQTNRARPFGAIPDLFGQGNATPDLLAPAELRYSNHKRVIRETFCLGIGEYTIEDTFDDVTNTDNIADFTVTTYGPGTAPSNLRAFRATSDVDNIELRAPDDPNFESSARGVFVKRNASVAIGTATFSNAANEITFNDYDNIRQLGLEVGDTLTVSGTTSNNGSYNVLGISFANPVVTVSVGAILTNETTSATLSAGKTDNVIHWFDTDIINNLDLSASDSIYISETSSNNGTFTIDSIAQYTDVEFGGVVRIFVTETVVDEDDSAATLGNVASADPWTDWFILPGEGETVRVFLTAPQGLQGENETKITIGLDVELEEVDIDGVPVGGGASYSNTYSLSGNTRDRRAVHKDIAVTKSRYRVRAKRNTDVFENAIDLVNLEQVAMMENYSGSEFGNVTVIDVVRRENSFRSGKSSGKFNVDYIRKLPSWTPGGGYDATLTNSYDVFRAALYQHVVAGGYPIEQMDVQGLYDINQSMSADLRAFAGSFDDVNMSHAERMKVILNAARVFAYRDGQIWRFWRDESRHMPVASFDIRNLTGNDSITNQMGLPGDFDSVSVQYRDPTTNVVETVSRRINLSTGAIVDDEIGVKVKTINLVGCRNSTQATNRADYEIRLIRDAERTVSTEVLGDWKYLAPGDVVRWADIYDSDVHTGEIKAISGTEYTTNNLLPQDAGTYYGTITDADGDVSTPVVVTITGDKTFTATFDVTGFVSDGSEIQCGSRYTIGSLADMNYGLYWVASIQPSDTRSSAATLTLLNYDDTTYEDD